MTPEPDWEAVRTFAAIARRGSVRGAARQLGVHHSTVSRRLESLERDLGTRLFERHPEGLLLTAAGEQLIDASNGFRESLIAATRAIAGQDNALAGQLTVTCPEPLAEQVLGPRLAAFQDAHPQLELRVLISDSFLDVARREADIALRADNNPPGTLVGKRLFRYYQAVYASPEYLERVDPVRYPERAHWLGWDEGGQRHLNWAQDTAFAAAPVRGEFPGLNMQRIAAVNGLGLAMLPCMVGDTDPGLRRVTDAEPLPSREIWLLTHADLRNTARVRTFMQFAERAMQEMRGVIEGRR